MKEEFINVLKATIESAKECDTNEELCDTVIKPLLEYLITVSNEVEIRLGQIKVEIDEEIEVVRVYYGDRVVRIWYNQDTIQTSKLPHSTSKIINEYISIFSDK